MSTITTPSHRLGVLHPLTAAATGAAIYGLAMAAGEVYDLNAGTDGEAASSATDIAAYVALVVAAGVIAVWLGTRARAGTPKRLAMTSLALAIAATVTFVAFWSGWPHVFGAVAVVLAVEHRRRVGSFSVTTGIALGLGAIALVSAAVTCLLG